MTSTITPNLFNLAQTFFVDPSVSSSNPTCQITGIDLFFMYKPGATNNRSGINMPGVTVFISPTLYNIPQVTQKTYTQFARAEWPNIITSSDASVPTRFTFNTPITIDTGTQYAFLVSFDGNENFLLWSAVNGYWEVGTRAIYNNNNGNLIGNYYQYTNNDNVNPITAATQTELLNIWKPLNNSELTFTVYAARYFANGVPYVANTSTEVQSQIHNTNLNQVWDSTAKTLSYIYPSQCNENIAFDINLSTVQMFIGAQKVFQNTVPYPGGYSNGSTYVTLSSNGSTIVTANSTLPNGASFAWNTVFGGYTGTKYLTILSNDESQVNVRQVTSVVNNTVVILDEPTTFTANNAKFLIAPVATIDSVLPSSPFGKRDSFMFLTNSNANSSVRFVNNCIETISVVNGGSGYSNSDVLYITGFENVSGKITGGYNAIANISTNSSGGITTIYQSNLGCGFTNSSAIVATIANSTSTSNTSSNTSAGSSASFTYSIGATLNTELTDNIFKSCIVTNLDISDVTPFFQINVPSSSTYELALQTQYYITSDPATSSGLAYYVDPAPVVNKFTVLKKNTFIGSQVPCFVSYSNEYVTLYANGTNNDKVNPLSPSSNNYVVEIITTNNDDFNAVVVNSTPSFEFNKYIINNDYFYEETNLGNAWSKHLTTTINFDQLAEDVRVYLDVYRPPGTDIQVYARIQNSGDPQSYTNEDYTRLQCIQGQSIFSSPSNPQNYVNMGFGFQNQPNTAFTIGSTVSTSNASAVVTASSNAFSQVTANTLVKLYDPMFSNANFLVASIKSVTNNTVIVLDQNVSSNINQGGNPALVGSGLMLDVMGWNNQAFNNIDNSNVVRYYNKSSVKYDGYDIISLKVVMLSSQFGAIPRLHDISAVGVTA